MAEFPERDLSTEVAKQFRGTPAERIEVALRLGRDVLDLYLATQPPGISRQLARQILQRDKHSGRRPSAVTR